jgi:hypothetical protein
LLFERTNPFLAGVREGVHAGETGVAAIRLGLFVGIHFNQFGGCCRFIIGSTEGWESGWCGAEMGLGLE